MRTHKMVFFGNSRSAIPLCYIDSLVDAVILALTRDEAVGQGYLVGNGAYAGIAGLRRQAGLYTLLASLIIQATSTG